jgi:NADH dehydrogenase [ubiquinone] 1 alpha subcomplex assembly factor 7
MSSIQDVLKNLIAQQGPLSLYDYIKQSLYHPVHGYYMKQSPLGAKGDFITAPEISQMFGELLGLWLLNQWDLMKQPAKISLIELGPGKGTLLKDILRACQIRPAFSQALDLHLVEISPFLTTLQKETLKHPLMTWHTSLASALKASQGHPLFFIANEFFDALPIQQFMKTDQGWVEKHVTFNPLKQTFEFCFPQGLSFKSLPLQAQEIALLAPDTTVIEISPDAPDILKLLADSLAKRRGAGLIIDYGYSDNVSGDTFQALKNHHYHDPLQEPGSADLTAHVNFSILQREAVKFENIQIDFIIQGDFLKKLSLTLRAEQLKKQATPEQKTKIDRDVHRLIHPQEMGHLFKVMALYNHGDPL